MNSKIVPSDIEINETIVTKLLHDQFGLAVHHIGFLGEGFDSTVFLVNKKWVFRFPRRAEAVVGTAAEMSILPLIVDRLPLPVPRPTFKGVPSNIFPRIFYGHELIEGVSGCSVTLSSKEYECAATDLGKFLRVLHDIDVEELGLAPADLSIHFDRTNYPELKKKFDERLMQIASAYDLVPFRSKFDEICDGAQNFQGSDNVLVHGDMYHRHLIFGNNNRLCGVIDWGDSALADPVSDLGIVYQFFPKTARSFFFAAYGDVDEERLRYARFIGLYLAVALLWFGHDRNDADLIRTSLWTFAEI